MPSTRGDARFSRSSISSVSGSVAQCRTGISFFIAATFTRAGLKMLA